MLPINVIIKIFSYLPAMLENGKRDPWFLELRLLRKKIAAAFRPTKLFLTAENFYSNMDHIKTIEWKSEDFEYNDIKEIVNHKYIPKLISDYDIYNFKDFSNVRSLICKTNINVVIGGSYSSLTYYKGPYNRKFSKFKDLKKIYLTNTSVYMKFNDALKKLTIDVNNDNKKKLDLSFSKIEKLVLKNFGYITELKLPATLKLFKISNKVLGNNLDVVLNCCQEKKIEYKIITF